MRLAFYVIIILRTSIASGACVCVCAGLTSLLTTFERPPSHLVAVVYMYVEYFDVLSDVLYGQRHRHWRYHTASKWLCLRWPQCISFAASILATQSIKQSTSPTRIGFIRKVICLSNSVAIRPNGTHQWRLSRTQCSSISAQRKARVCAVCHK